MSTAHTGTAIADAPWQCARGNVYACPRRE